MAGAGEADCALPSGAVTNRSAALASTGLSAAAIRTTKDVGSELSEGGASAPVATSSAAMARGAMPEALLIGLPAASDASDEPATTGAWAAGGTRDMRGEATRASSTSASATGSTGKSGKILPVGNSPSCRSSVPLSAVPSPAGRTGKTDASWFSRSAKPSTPCEAPFLRPLSPSRPAATDWVSGVFERANEMFMASPC